MTRTLSNFKELATIFAANTLGALVEAEIALSKAAHIVQADAKNRIGMYQSAVGPFPAWAPLADSTEAQKATLGYPSDAPLLREGDLRDSIVTEHSALSAIIGSKMDIAAYQEFGTETIPPRPFLGPAAEANKKKIVALLGTCVMEGLAGNTSVYQNLGHDPKP